METIQVKDKKFVVSISEEEILKQVKRVASEINRDFNASEPLFLAVLNGSFMFAADLMREITLPGQISFIKLASYDGLSSSGQVRECIGLDFDLQGRDVIIVEDIVDSGLTMKHLMDNLQKMSPRSLSVCSLLVKPGNLKADIKVRYKCFEIPNDFIVGYGLDYDGYGRNTRDIYTLQTD